MSGTSNDKLALLFGRRSIRVYAPGEVGDEAVTRLLEAAMAAPSAMTKDPWRFVVVRSQETRNRLSAALAGGKMLSTAALAIAVCGDMDAVLDRQLSYLLQDCSACIENLLLAAHGLGLGACWVGVHPLEDAVRAVKELLTLPTPFIPIAVVALGLPGEQPEPRTRYNREYVRFEKWGRDA
jgi:nitroreductase